mgnify:CR=1 FL=1
MATTWTADALAQALRAAVREQRLDTTPDRAQGGAPVGVHPSVDLAVVLFPPGEVDFGTPQACLQFDARLLEIMFTNLLGNAAKFTGTRSEPKIEFGCEAQDDPESKVRRTVFFVRDNGVGIPKETLDQLGRPFIRQKPQTTDRHNGSGLGIFICRSIVELHGGRLEIASDVGRGTTATVHLPAERVTFAAH